MVKNTLYIPIDNARNPYEKIFITFYNEIFVDLTLDIIDNISMDISMKNIQPISNSEYDVFKKRRHLTHEYFKKIIVSEYLIAEKITSPKDVIDAIQTLAKIRYNEHIVYNYLSHEEAYDFFGDIHPIIGWIEKRVLHWSEDSIKFYEIELEGRAPDKVMYTEYIEHYKERDYLAEMYEPYTEDHIRFYELIHHDGIYDFVIRRLENDLRSRDRHSALRIRNIEDDTLYEVIIF